MAHVEWEDLRRRHSNCLNGNGWPVLSWEEFVAEAEDMIAAEDEFRRAMAEVNVLMDRLVPAEERYCAWHLHAPAPIVAINDLFGWDAPNLLHPSDFRFHLTYGKAKRAPVAYMRRRAEGFRAYVRKANRVLAKNLKAAEASVAV